MIVRTAAAATLCLLLASTVRAQDHQTTGVFVGAGAHAAITNYPSSVISGRAAFDRSTDLSGVAAGGSIALGTFLKSAVTLRLELSTAGRLSASVTAPNSSGGSIVSFGPSSGIVWDTLDGPASTIQRSSRDRDVFVLAGYHTSAVRRVRLAYLAGVTIQHSSTTTDTVDFVPSYGGSNSAFTPLELTWREERTTIRSSNVGTGLALGLDADVSLSSRVTVTPHVRVVADGGTLSVRPGLQLRVAFR